MLSVNHKRVTIDDVRCLFIDFGAADIDASNETELHHASTNAMNELIRDHDRNVL